MHINCVDSVTSLLLPTYIIRICRTYSRKEKQMDLKEDVYINRIGKEFERTRRWTPIIHKDRWLLALFGRFTVRRGDSHRRINLKHGVFRRCTNNCERRFAFPSSAECRNEGRRILICYRRQWALRLIATSVLHRLSLSNLARLSHVRSPLANLILPA